MADKKTRKTLLRRLLLVPTAHIRAGRALIRKARGKAEWGKTYPIKKMKKRPVSAEERRRILEETMPEKYKKKKKAPVGPLTKKRKSEAERMREAAGQ